ncbi:eukaryotic translation initiation factor 4 gamma 1a isoform X2 [Anguilla anguilla]|nr:eukaryotic translation initiation factor 4 gamma 1a isoform X2 [Anguilla anguilla]XP_035277496.1 eukaryotic translation initiation factor 4 gamma 1a isoform X2 [Anguilla anguilla]
MSGGRTTPTPTPPPCGVGSPEGDGPIQANGVREPTNQLNQPADADTPESGEGSAAPAPETLPLPPTRIPKPVPTAPPADETGADGDNPVSAQAEELLPPGETPKRSPPPSPTPPPSHSASDSEDAPLPAPAPAPAASPAGERPVTTATGEQFPVPETEEEEEEEEEQEESLTEKQQGEPARAVVDADPGPAPSPAPDSSRSPAAPADAPSGLSNGTAVAPPPSGPHGPPEAPSSRRQELRLPNGLGPVPSSPVVTETTPADARTGPHPPPGEEEAPDRTAPVQASESAPTGRRKEAQEEPNREEQMGGVLEAFKEEQAVEGPSELEQAQADVPHDQPAMPTSKHLPSSPTSEPSPATPTSDPSPATPTNDPRPATPTSDPSPATPTLEPRPTTPAGEPDEEEKQDPGSLKPEALKLGDLKYQYKREQWKPIDQEEKKRYDREFLLGFQFAGVSMHKPEGLPHISDVVLDKAHRTPLRPVDPSRMTGMSCGPDFTPSFANLGRQPTGSRAPPPGMGGGRRSQQGQRKEPPRKIIASVSLSEDVQLNRADKAWKPSARKGAGPGPGAGPGAGPGPGGRGQEDPDAARTQELFRQVRSVLNKLTPQMFQPLMKQVSELAIDTTERLKGVIDLVFEKAISEPNFSVAYANMCRCLTGLKVPTAEKQTVTVNFRKLLLNRCQMEFEKDKDNDQIFEQKQKEMEAAATEEERQRLKEELEEAREMARRRSLGNIKFIGELFKLKMLTEAIMHDCVVKLLKSHDEESLECLCRLLTTIGKDLDFQKAKPRMDQYFTQMEKIIKERKTSSRIRFMLQDVLDLRQNSWVPRRSDQGPKTIQQIHKEAELEEQREQVKVQQQLLSKKDMRGGGAGPGGGVRGGPHAGPGGRGPHPQDEGWNTVPVSAKSRPIDTSRLSKITKPGTLDFNNQLLAPGGKGTWGSWGKGSSGGSGFKPSGEAAPESGRPATSTLNRFSALQQPSSSLSRSAESDPRTPRRNSSSRDRGDRGDRFERPERLVRGGDRPDRQRLPVTKRSYGREGEPGGPREALRRVSSMTDDRGSRDRGSRDRGTQDRGSRDRGTQDRGSRDGGTQDRGSRDRGTQDRGSRDGGTQDRGSRDRGTQDRGSRDQGTQDRGSTREMAQHETAPMAPPTLAPPKPAMSEEDVERKSKAIIEEYLHINEMKEALQCVREMDAPQQLSVFVRTGVESTLERSAIARQHMGLLLHQLLKAGTLPPPQYYKGLQEILEVAEDMAIDIPHIWLYLAEIITPVLHEGGIHMSQLFREVSKPLLPLGKAAVLLVEILLLLCKGMSHKKAGLLWREAGLSWRDFLPEDEDVNKFVTDMKVEFTLGDDLETASRKGLPPAQLQQQLDELILQKADNQRVFDWVEANLDEQQASSSQLVRALMTSVCQSAIIGENPYKVDAEQVTQRAKLLQKYLTDEQKELQALYALQALMVKMEQPANLLRMFFDTLYDEDVIKEEAFYRWESSKDPAEQQGKGVALKSVIAFFTWLREAEEESDNS